MALNDIFKIQYKCELIRLGQKNDGGYLICKKSIAKTEYLVSLGISDDFSFEEEFLNIKKGDIKIKCYDDILDQFFLIKKIIFSLLRAIYEKKIQVFKLQKT